MTSLITPSNNINSTSDYLLIPNPLTGYTNVETELTTIKHNRLAYVHYGHLVNTADDSLCHNCGSLCHINGQYSQKLRHIPVGSTVTDIVFDRNQFLCPYCGQTHMQSIPFKSDSYRITKPLHTYICDLLAKGLTNKSVASIVGLSTFTIKSIDKKRLESLYIKDGSFIKPTSYALFLGIDEFLLHENYKYATHIIDLTTGHVLWIAEGKKKQVVYDFIDHVGETWMSHVQAVAMDMNSDFQEAFVDKCPHISIVFDRFHIVKNFNDKVISEVRKDEQRRLTEEGDTEGAKSLKNSRYILTSSKETRERRDQQAAASTDSNQQNRPSQQEQYQTLINKNKLLFTADLVREKLNAAYSIGFDEEDPLSSSELLGSMRATIQETIDICNATGNAHFIKFANLLSSHIEGIVSHALYYISSGKVEGLNNKIKTLRRQAYGIPDNYYFFLKVMDASRMKT